MFVLNHRHPQTRVSAGEPGLVSEGNVPIILISQAAIKFVLVLVDQFL